MLRAFTSKTSVVATQSILKLCQAEVACFLRSSGGCYATRQWCFEGLDQSWDVRAGLFQDGVEAVRGPCFTATLCGSRTQVAQYAASGCRCVEQQTARSEHAAANLRCQSCARRIWGIGHSSASSNASARSAQALSGQKQFWVGASRGANGRYESAHTCPCHLRQAKGHWSGCDGRAKGDAAFAVRDQIFAADSRKEFVQLLAKQVARTHTCCRGDDRNGTSPGADERSGGCCHGHAQTESGHAAIGYGGVARGTLCSAHANFVELAARCWRLRSRQRLQVLRRGSAWTRQPHRRRGGQYLRRLLALAKWR